MNKYQKYRPGKKKEFQSIAALQSHLFGQLEAIRDTSHLSNQPESYFNQFREHEPLSSFGNHINQDILSKAKYVTSTHKGKIARMKKQVHKLNQGEGAQFLTGVRLFEKETPEEPQYSVNQGNMMRNLASSKVTDLQELRRMIKKTQNNLRVYSQSVYKTQTKIVNAADKIGQDIDAGLAIKINKCNLNQIYSRPSKPKTPALATGGQKMRRKTLTAYNSRRTKATD